MSQTSVRMRQLVDWSAAAWAGLIAGIVFLLSNMLITWLSVGSPWIIVRLMASVVMGEEVLPPPADFEFGIFLVALLVHFILSFVFALILAYIIHRWGIIVGIVGGALFGLGLYGINFYTMTLFFPWFFTFVGWALVLTHILFGATAGGVYELLEIEEFVEIEED